MKIEEMLANSLINDYELHIDLKNTPKWVNGVEFKYNSNRIPQYTLYLRCVDIDDLIFGYMSKINKIKISMKENDIVFDYVHVYKAHPFQWDGKGRALKWGFNYYCFNNKTDMREWLEWQRKNVK